MYYLIEETLTEVGFEQIKNSSAQYVATLTPDEWETQKDSFDMGIDIEPDFQNIHSTKAEVNYDSLTGSFLSPTGAIFREAAKNLPLRSMKRE